MKKLALAFFALAVCSGAWAKVDLDKSLLLSPGMSKQEVIDTLGGRPVTVEFINTLEEWHFCTDRFSWDLKFTAVYFIDGSLYAMKDYRVNKKDSQCERHIKKGTYSEPDIVKEYRIKYR